jgi:hypothetical protein
VISIENRIVAKTNSIIGAAAAARDFAGIIA